MTNPSEPVCVCGHPKSVHTEDRIAETDYGRDCCHYYGCSIDDCECMDFQESLPWPNAEGLWWMQTDLVKETVYARDFGNGYIDILRFGHECSWRPPFDNARFTRVLEQSPFPTEATPDAQSQ